MGFLLLLVKNFFFLESKLIPFLLSFLSVLVVLLTMRAMVASSSLVVDDSTSIFFDLPLWEALRAKSFFSFLVDEELSWGLMCMYISWALIFHKMDVGVAVERSPWWSMGLCAHIFQWGGHIVSSSPHLANYFGWVQVHLVPLQWHSSENTFH